MTRPTENKMARYFGLLDGRAGAFGVSFPDAPGCAAMGKTEDEAVTNAITALAEWLAHSDKNGLGRPMPRHAIDMKDDEDVRVALLEGAVFVRVPVLADSGRQVRANISVDAGILEAIDEAADTSGMTRSAYLVSAALDRIKATG